MFCGKVFTFKKSKTVNNKGIENEAELVPCRPELIQTRILLNMSSTCSHIMEAEFISIPRRSSGYMQKPVRGKIEKV
jgi:hypothetical protein